MFKKTNLKTTAVTKYCLVAIEYLANRVYIMLNSIFNNVLHYHNIYYLKWFS
jgi:hypothetical protein